MRDLSNVIEQIIEEIPKKEKGFIADLKDNLSSLERAAPETISFWWDEVFNTLTDNINMDNKKKWTWEWEVFSIWTCKSISELKESEK